MKIKTASTIGLISISTWMVIQILHWTLLALGFYRTEESLFIAKSLDLITPFFLGAALIIFLLVLKSKNLSLLDDNDDERGTGESYVIKSIGGWLILPAIGIVIGLIVTLPIVGFFAYGVSKTRGAVAGGLATVSITQFFLFCYLIYVAQSFFNKKRNTPKSMITYMIVGMVLNLVYIIVGVAVNNGDFVRIFSSALFSGIVSASIWIPYFMVSERVKRTFVVE